MTDERSIDGLVTAWLRAEATTGGASGRVLERALDQVTNVGQDRSVIPWRLPERQARRLALVAVIAATLLAMAGVAVFIGSELEDEAVPAPSRLVPIATPVPVPAGLSAEVVDRGAADASIGQVRWTSLLGDETNLPSEWIVATPDGFASLEPGLPQNGSRLLVSSDGLDWSEAPLPVPATTRLHLARSGDEFWISSEDDQLWRSTDFETWTEVDLGDIVPPGVHGFDRRTRFGPPVTIGAASVLPLHVTGSLALDQLFDVALEPNEILRLSGGYRDQVLGDVRDVIRAPSSSPGFEADARVVGSIRLSVAGSVITVLDATSGAAMAWFDTASLGADATSVAERLNENEPFTYPVGTLVLTEGGVREAGLPLGASVMAVEGAFIAVADDDTIWRSTDGLEWTSLGLPTLPPTALDLGDLHATAEPGGGLGAVMMLESDGVQTFEYWTSRDGLDWDRVGVLPAGVSQVIPIGPGRYLAKGDDLAMRSSTTTEDWTHVEGLDGFDSWIGESGGMSLHSVAGDTVFMVEVALTGERVLWVIELEPTAS